MAETIDSFERRFSAAALKGINAETWDLFIRTINARLKGVEEKKAAFEATEQLLVSIGLQRINEALLPAFQTITGLAHLGAIFTATSTTTLEVGVGQKQLTIAQEYRERFAPSAYLAIRASGQTSPVMTGSLANYHRESGTLTINVDYADGEGSHASWVISPTASPDYDGVVLVRGNAPPDLDTLEKIAAAIGNDPDFAETIANAFESLGNTLSTHKHDDLYVPLSREIATQGLATGGGSLGQSRTIDVPKAAGADMRAGTNDDKALTTKAAYDSVAEVALTDAATIVIDLQSGTDFRVTLNGNRTLGNPINADKVVGKKGRIRILHSNRSLAFGSNWKFAGGEAPDLSSGSNKTDILYYDVIAANFILGVLVPEIS